MTVKIHSCALEGPHERPHTRAQADAPIGTQGWGAASNALARGWPRRCLRARCLATEGADGSPCLKIMCAPTDRRRSGADPAKEPTRDSPTLQVGRPDLASRGLGGRLRDWRVSTLCTSGQSRTAPQVWQARRGWLKSGVQGWPERISPPCLSDHRCSSAACRLFVPFVNGKGAGSLCVCRMRPYAGNNWYGLQRYYKRG